MTSFIHQIFMKTLFCARSFIIAFSLGQGVRKKSLLLSRLADDPLPHSTAPAGLQLIIQLLGLQTAGF